MKKLILLILLSATFVGGYQLGRRPDSPDIVGTASRVVRQAVGLGQRIADRLADSRQGRGSGDRSVEAGPNGPVDGLTARAIGEVSAELQKQVRQAAESQVDRDGDLHWGGMTYYR